MTHVNSLEEILRNAKKPVRGFLLREEFMADIPVDQRISFSSVSREDLDKVRCKNGLERGATHHRRGSISVKPNSGH